MGVILDLGAQPVHGDGQRVVVDEVAKGESVRLIGFGTFGLTERAPRTGRNPQTGTVIKIPGCKAPKFTAGASFKEAVK